MTSTLTGHDQPPVAPGRLWAGLILAPAAWSATELVGFVISSRECRGAVGTGIRAGTVQDVLAIGMGIIAVVGLVIAVGNWRRVREPAAVSAPPAQGRAHFMALVGVVTSALFVLGIVFFALPPFLISACRQVQ